MPRAFYSAMMQPPEPPRQATSLELPSEPRIETPDSAPSGLELPPSAARLVAPEDSEPARIGAPSGPLGELVVAHFRRVEVAMLGRVLITTLAGALPPSMVALERHRSLGRRLSRRAGEPIGITITAGERVLSFRSPQLGVVEASVGHSVRGVVLSSTPVPLAQWIDELGDLLEQVTREDEAARTALERALLS